MHCLDCTLHQRPFLIQVLSSRRRSRNALQQCNPGTQNTSTVSLDMQHVQTIDKHLTAGTALRRLRPLRCLVLLNSAPAQSA